MSKDKTIGRVDVSMFGEKTGIADVKLLVDGQSIPINKAVLTITSPVFRAMFQGDSNEKAQDVIPLPGKKLDDVLTLLRCIYPDIMLPITEKVAIAVLPLTEEYQMTFLKTKCEDVLLQSLGKKYDGSDMKDSAYVYNLLSMSIKFGSQRIKEYCVSLVADFKQNERKQSNLSLILPADVVKQIEELAISRLELRNDDVLALVSEMEKYDNRARAERAISNFLSGANCCVNNTHNKCYLRGLRLAYLFGNIYKDIKTLAVSKVRNYSSCRWDEEYKLLPEYIKHDIECSPTPE